MSRWPGPGLKWCDCWLSGSSPCQQHRQGACSSHASSASLVQAGDAEPAMHCRAWQCQRATRGTCEQEYAFTGGSRCFWGWGLQRAWYSPFNRVPGTHGVLLNYITPQGEWVSIFHAVFTGFLLTWAPHSLYTGKISMNYVLFCLFLFRLL